MLCYVTLCYVTLCYVMLHYVMLCYIILYHSISYYIFIHVYIYIHIHINVRHLCHHLWRGPTVSLKKNAKNGGSLELILSRNGGILYPFSMSFQLQ